MFPLAKKAQEAELAMLFNEALTTGPKKGGVAGKGKPEEAVAVETKEKKVQETIIIEEGEKTLEDLIEEQRAKLHAEGRKGTPVNQETLAKWKADRRAKKIEEERRRVEAEMKKKSKGKGLSVLSGRALFDYDATLLEDDLEAAGEDVMNQRNEAQDDEDDERGSEEGAVWDLARGPEAMYTPPPMDTVFPPARIPFSLGETVLKHRLAGGCGRRCMLCHATGM